MEAFRKAASVPIICTAKALLKEYWDLKVPIDPEFFAENLGLTVIQEPLGYRSDYLDAARKTIHVNSVECRERQRFTVARELGHYCLGHGTPAGNNAAHNVGKDYGAAEEAAANKFAEELVMPAVVIRALAEKMGVDDPIKLRKALGVTAPVMYARLSSLGYFL